MVVSKLNDAGVATSSMGRDAASLRPRFMPLCPLAALGHATVKRFSVLSNLGKWRGFFGNESGGMSKNPRGLW